MDAKWIGGNELRPSHGGADEGGRVGGELRLSLTKPAGEVTITFPVGDASEGAAFSLAMAAHVVCEAPANVAVTRSLNARELAFTLTFASPDDANVVFSRMLCDTGDGVSLTRITGGVETVLPLYRKSGERGVRFYGDAFADYLGEATLNWQVDGIDGAKVCITPADTVSGKAAFDSAAGSAAFKILCDTVFVLAVYDGDTLAATLTHKVCVREAEVLEFRVQPENENWRVHLLMKNRRHAFLSGGIGRVDCDNAYEKNGDTYAAFDGLVPKLNDTAPSLCWPPNFELPPAYLSLTCAGEGERVTEKSYGVVKWRGGVRDLRIATENAAGTVRVETTYDENTQTLSTLKIFPENLGGTFDTVYRMRSKTASWTGWAVNGENCGILEAGTCADVEAKLVKKGLGVGYAKLPGQSPALIDARGAGLRCEVFADGKWRDGAGNDSAVYGIRLTPEKFPSGGAAFTVCREIKGKAVWLDAQNDETFDEPLTAIRVKLTGCARRMFDVAYRANVSELGVLAYAENGSAAGTIGGGFSLRGIEFQVTPKTDKPPTPNLEMSVVDYTRSFAAIRTRTGGRWNNAAENGESESAGGEPITAVSISAANVPGVGIEAKYQFNGEWDEEWRKDGDLAERGGSLQGVQLRLTGANARLFDLCCKTRNETEMAVTAIEARLVPKGGAKLLCVSNES